MACRYNVTLNNVTMASLDSSIIIHDVCYEAPEYERDLFSVASLNGARTGNAYKRRCAVSVLFEIHEYDIADRQGVLVKIINWAKNGGDLRINDRPNQKLICVCDEFPYIDSAMSWLNELSITFAAYEIPYWQSATNTTTTAQYRKSASTDKLQTYQYITCNVPGDAPYALPKSITVENFSKSSQDTVYFEMKNSTRNANDFMCITTMLPANTSCKIVYSYDDRQIMTFQMRYGTTVTNLIGKYTNASKIHEILLNCGVANQLGISLTTRVAGTSSNTYTPLNADVTVVYGGLWE